MALTIKRLHELSRAELLALGAWMRAEIQPDSISAGSDYVCQVSQEAHYWGDKYLATLQKEGGDVDIWVALDAGPVATCWVAAGSPDRMITLFLVAAGLTDPEQLVASDAIARRAVEDMMATGFEGDLISTFPDNSKAADYAKLCGFAIDEGPTTAGLKPIKPWRQNIKALHDSILGRAK